jgi:uncharacterized membrane protein YdbT with pleckstrin-like domain
MAYSFHPSPLAAFCKISLAVIFLTVMATLLDGVFPGIFIPALALIWIAAIGLALVAFISVRTITITIEENILSYSRGILTTRKVLLPYAKITETSYVQGILERLLGIGTLSIDTPGGSEVAIHVSGLRYDDVKELLHEINRRSGKNLI